jgi:hypothetical protein
VCLLLTVTSCILHGNLPTGAFIPAVITVIFSCRPIHPLPKQLLLTLATVFFRGLLYLRTVIAWLRDQERQEYGTLATIRVSVGGPGLSIDDESLAI